MKAKVSVECPGEVLRKRLELERRGPIQYTGPSFEQEFEIPNGATHVRIFTANSLVGSFNVAFEKEKRS